MSKIQREIERELREMINYMHEIGNRVTLIGMRELEQN